MITDMYLEFLHEATKKASMSRIDRDDKINREVGRLSVSVASDKEDSNVKRMEYHFAMYKKFKQRINDKYASRVKTTARR